MDPNILRLAMGAGGEGGPEYQLWSWGYNGNGELGQNNLTYYSSPVQVGSLKNWKTISAGHRSNAAIKTDGTLWTWGFNSIGQLGTGNTTNYSSPVQVGTDTNWSSVSAGIGYMLAVKTDGTLWAWGAGAGGRLGVGSTTNYSSPIQVGSLTNWAKVSAGGTIAASLAIKTDGTLWAWAANANGQLGLGNTTAYDSPVQVGSLTNWASVYSSGSWTHAIKTDGTLWAWGNNAQGQLALGDTTNRSSPVQVGSLTNWRSVSRDLTSANGVISVKTDNTAWAWGENNIGQLGINDTSGPYSSPIQIGALANWSVIECDGYSSIGLKTDGTIWTWGYNYYGQLGTGNTTYYSSPVQVGALTTWQSVAAGRFFMLATKKP